MKKYLIPSTLLAVAALATPAFADEVNITFAPQNGAGNTTLNWEVNTTYGYYVAANLSTDEYFTFEWGALTATDTSGGTIASPQIMNQNQNPLNEGTVIPYNAVAYTLSFTFTATEDIEISYIAFQFVGDFNGGSFDNAASSTSDCEISLTADEDTLFSGTVTLYGTSKSEVEGHTGDHYTSDYLVIMFDDAITLEAGESITFTLGVADGNTSDSLRTGIEGIDVGVRALPEPSMFGLFFGLGAIGLVATRRRRR